MTEKTTEVVVSETNNGQQTAKQSRRKPAARKAATTKKKAAKKEDAVEPVKEIETKTEAPAKKPQRRGRKPKQTAVEAAKTITENNDAPVQTINPEPISEQQPEVKPEVQDAVVEVENQTFEEPRNEEIKAEEGMGEEEKVEEKADENANTQQQASNTQHLTPQNQSLHSTRFVLTQSSIWLMRQRDSSFSTISRFSSFHKKRLSSVSVG